MMRIVIPSLGYSDFLETTLPEWRRVFPAAEIVVATADGDPSFDVAVAHGAEPVLTDAWTRAGAVFNKAAALDVALGSPAIGEVCLVADADVVPCGRPPFEDEVDADVLYGCPRFLCPDLATLDAHLSGEISRAQLALMLPRQSGDVDLPLAHQHDALLCTVVARRALGYCQIFRYRAGLRFGSSHSAGGYDNRFGRQFYGRDALPGDFYVLHLGGTDRRNWQGRVLPPWGSR